MTLPHRIRTPRALESPSTPPPSRAPRRYPSVLCADANEVAVALRNGKVDEAAGRDLPRKGLMLYIRNNDMRKHLSAIGNSLGLVIEKPILDLLNIGRDTELEVVTDGERIIVEPVRHRQAPRAVREIGEVTAPEFLGVDDVIALHDALLEEHGGQAGIRDRGLLESAVAMPMALCRCTRGRYSRGLERSARSGELLGRFSNRADRAHGGGVTRNVMWISSKRLRSIVVAPGSRPHSTKPSDAYR